MISLSLSLSLHRGNYDPVRYNGTEPSEGKGAEKEGKEERGEGSSAMEKFSFSDLPRLDYSVGDDRARPATGGGLEDQSRDQMAMALRELHTASRSVVSSSCGQLPYYMYMYM